MKTILTYVRPKLPAISLGLTIKFTGTIIELLLPWMLSVILDKYVPSKNMKMIWLWGFLMIVCAAAAFVTNVLANRMATRTSRDITRKLRHDLFTKITTLSCAQEDAFTTPSLIARLTSDTYNVHQMIDRMQRLGVRAPILLTGGIVVTFLLEPVLTMVLLAVLPLLALVVWLVSRGGIMLYTKTQTALDELVRRAQESMAGIRVIQALSKTDYECRRFEEANSEVVRRERRAGLLMNITNPVMNLLLNFGLTFVIIVGAYRVHAGAIQTGTIIAFLSYFVIILNALMMVSRLFMLYSKGAASGRRISEILEASEEMQAGSFVSTGALTRKTNCPHIEFDHVSFSYNKVHPNISDVSFSVNHGETLGIIGATGSGKSTLLYLLLRFYDVDSGAVRIDGVDVRAMDPGLLHTMFGAAFQNDFLYSDTLWENIDFGRGLSGEALEAAARTAQADFVFSRAGGMDGMIASKGQDLSGGQKQRILISRALAANASILLLDDSSSALDYKTDAALRRGLAKDYKDTTKIIVAQRISSIQNADKILVMDEGGAVGYGTHEELLNTCESYGEIAKVQMGEVE